MKICAVVVTYNRIDLLKECIKSLRNQSHKLDEIIVVNNDSTDGTKEWLDEQNDLFVIHQNNLGGAGGFNTGIKTGYKRGFDWIWCMDDDTLPEQDSLQNLIVFKNDKDQGVGFLASNVLWKDKTKCLMNRVHPNSNNELKFASFVSLLLSRTAVEQVGLPIKEFFIWYDDMEYTYRISLKFPCYYVHNSNVIHYTEQNQNISWSQINLTNSKKYFFAIRNYIYFFRKNYSNIGYFKSTSEITTIIIRAIGGIIIPQKNNKVYLTINLLKCIFIAFQFNPELEKIS